MMTRVRFRHIKSTVFACSNPPGLLTDKTSHRRFRPSTRALRSITTLTCTSARLSSSSPIWANSPPASSPILPRKPRNLLRQSSRKKSVSKVKDVARHATGSPAPSGGSHMSSRRCSLMYVRQELNQGVKAVWVNKVNASFDWFPNAE